MKKKAYEIKIGDKIDVGVGVERVLKIRRTNGRLEGINDDQPLFHIYATSGYKFILSPEEGLIII